MDCFFDENGKFTFGYICLLGKTELAGQHENKFTFFYNKRQLKIT